ncbi:hypothetical protein [Flavobacterium sp.]|uniref:hypothetical protein n=1 Tax=Flavobacterium sp. TaxID=239 RepID=UPI0025C3289F|nr:hypothetical protein [Flavobacterium sp.]MDP2159366.1 hypothetical protein [Flavobacterium sp.]
MEEKGDDKSLIDNKITENFIDFEKEKEQKILNLLVEIIISTTLKELYEKSD